MRRNGEIFQKNLKSSFLENDKFEELTLTPQNPHPIQFSSSPKQGGFCIIMKS